MKSPRHIFLVGLSGTGKSTVGTLLARKLKMPFVDIDREIERKTRQKIKWLFEHKGERQFRKVEAALIKQYILDFKTPRVFALGGGAFENTATRRLVKREGVSIWLHCALFELARRLEKKSDRPLLTNRATGKTFTRRELRQKLSAILEKRIGNYRKADIRISTDKKSPSETAALIKNKLKKLYAAN